ncbi:MAG TPA: hypothetical protein VEB21_01160, partial [Terriglobales bacterium]|nr:hypothetical protein [Terriglobales bacterium]
MFQHLAALFVGIVLLAPSLASASFHDIAIREIFTGSTADPDAEYVMLQMYSAGQDHVEGHFLTVYDASGAPVQTVTFADDVANGSNQATILIATAEAETAFAVTADLLMAPGMDPSGGKVCWENLDCVSWGSFSGSATSPSPSGTPFGSGGGILVGHAIRRDISHGNSSTLQAGDDSNDSFEDFDCVATAMPINNAGASGSYTDPTPCPECGNNLTEIGEVCDGGDDAACPGGCTEACLCPVHDAVVLPLKPLKLKVPVDLAMAVTKKVKIKVVNADLHNGNDDIQLVASTGDCPAGVSVTTPDFDPPSLDDTVKLGSEDSATAVATVTVTAAAFTTVNAKAFGRCTLT